MSGKKSIIAVNTPASKIVPTQAKIVAVIVKAEIPTIKKAKRYKKKQLNTAAENPKAARFIISWKIINFLILM
jgi:hypothetical protein